MIGKLLFLRYDNFELVNLTENDNVFVRWSYLSQDVRSFEYPSGDLNTIKMKVVLTKY